MAELFIQAGYAKSKILSIIGLAKSSYYYKGIEDPRKRGFKGSHMTYTNDGKAFSNEFVVSQIEELLLEEFVEYGYLKVCHWLKKRKNYKINKKKVYRLMKENGLLNKRTKVRLGTKKWVKELVPDPQTPFIHLEMDIKYFYIGGKSRNIQVLTVIDVKSRWVLGQLIKWNIRQEDVKKLFDKIFSIYSIPKGFYIRNDNGSQFVAQQIQKYFKDKCINQEFCKPATPEQNAHIESYHSIVERAVCQKFEFENENYFYNTMMRFLKFYNLDRIHSGVDYEAPVEFLKKFNFLLNESHLITI